MAIVFIILHLNVESPKESVPEASTFQLEAGYFSQWATKKSGNIDVCDSIISRLYTHTNTLAAVKMVEDYFSIAEVF